MRGCPHTPTSFTPSFKLVVKLVGNTRLPSYAYISSVFVLLYTYMCVLSRGARAQQHQHRELSLACPQSHELTEALLYTCPHTTIYMCPLRLYGIHVLIPLYMHVCPQRLSYIHVLIPPPYMCPQTRSARAAAPTSRALGCPLSPRRTKV